MSEFEEVIKYLGEHLEVDIKIIRNPKSNSLQARDLNVRLLIGDVVISESCCEIPQTYHGK